MAGFATRLLAAIIGVWLAVASASAQDSAWLQIEAQPDLPSATAQATAYSGQFRDVSGFRSSTGWYLIVLGPMSADGAAARLADLRGSRQIPNDSFISDGSVFETQFWPPTSPTADTMPTPPRQIKAKRLPFKRSCQNPSCHAHSRSPNFLTSPWP